MIVGITGQIVKKDATSLHINTFGLVHEVFVSVNCSSAIDTKEVYLHTTNVIREDANILYGFLDTSEKYMFDTLIKINGVGPKAAMAVCSTFTPTTFATIVTANDVSALKRVPGIGPKSASRILVELSGFSLELVGGDAVEGNTNIYDASLALESLGFKKDVVAKVLKNIKSTETADIVKEALKLLQK